MSAGSVKYGTYFHDKAFPIRVRCFHIEVRLPQLEYTMNIFTIIGVVVVIVVVAGYFGLRA